MTDTHFQAGTVVTSTWANDVNNHVYGTVPTRLALKALDPERIRLSTLTESGREGTFVWATGDHSAQVAADTQDGIYLQASNTSANQGAWVRQLASTDLWQLDWFSVPLANSNGTGPDAAPAYNAMMTIANLVKPTGLHFSSGIYAFDSKPKTPTFKPLMRFSSGGAQPTVIVKRYLDTNAGVLSFENYGVSFEGDVYLTRTMVLSTSGGALLSANTNWVAVGE